MIQRAHHLSFRKQWFSVTLITLAMASKTFGGVSLGPLPASADQAEQQRIMQDYEAQKSQQKKLEAGRERYDLMLTNRARVLAGMAAELALRQQMAAIPSEPASAAYANEENRNNWGATTIGVCAIVVCFLSFRYYLHRQNSKEMTASKR